MGYAAVRHKCNAPAAMGYAAVQHKCNAPAAMGYTARRAAEPSRASGRAGGVLAVPEAAGQWLQGGQGGGLGGTPAKSSDGAGPSGVKALNQRSVSLSSRTKQTATLGHFGTWHLWGSGPPLDDPLVERLKKGKGRFHPDLNLAPGNKTNVELGAARRKGVTFRKGFRVLGIRTI
eukprot:842055-Prorocentrum_minimum.AAC.1